ncbi:hypothetical protein BDF22DRAFT_620040 [Syncephalis plumigaleata]|nr:hypothetical protein BDF22DRAFT_620040 [Syncephalis plumigaleata]
MSLLTGDSERDNKRIIDTRGRKRIDWYLSRGLAELIDDTSRLNDLGLVKEDEDNCSTVIQLNFITRGRGRAGDAYYLEDRQDQCVGCGSSQHLTMHHVVPEVYRHHMPLTVKSRSSYDILPLCGHCHDKYEQVALTFKKSLAIQYGIPLEGMGWVECREEGAVRRAASALLLHRNKIPQERQEMLVNLVKEWWRNQTRETFTDQTEIVLGIPRQVLERASLLKQRVKGPEFIEHDAYVVEQLVRRQETIDAQRRTCRWPDLEAFIRQWRQHFVDHVHPTHLSTHWHVDAPIYTYV